MLRRFRRASRRPKSARRLHTVSGKSVIVRTSIDVDCPAGDEAAVLADEEQAGRGDLVDTHSFVSDSLLEENGFELSVPRCLATANSGER